MRNSGTSLSGVKYLLRFVQPYRLRLIGAILSGILKEVCIISATGIVAWMAAVVAGGGTFSSRLWLWLLAAIVAGRAVFAYLESYLNHDISYHILVDFRVALYGAFEKICPDILTRTRSGHISTTLMNDVEVLEWFYAHTVGIFVIDGVLVTAIAVFLGTLHIALALLLILFTGLLVTVPFLMKKTADAQGNESRHRLGEANAVTLEGINGLNEILTLNYRDQYRRKNWDFMEAMTRVQVRYARRMGAEGGLLQAVSGIAAVCVNLCGVWLVLWNRLPMEWFAVVGTTVWLVFGPEIELCNTARNFGIIFAAAGRIANIIDSEPLVKDEGKPYTGDRKAPEVRFDKVRYRYAGASADVLHDVSFAIRPGSVTALVGESGAGKTTCAHLLMRMWDVCGGSISIDGVDLRDMALKDLHSLVSLVPQDVYLFNASMKENIKLGRTDATDEEVVRAAKLAKIHDFIVSLPEGYETAAGERGVQMSGGQRQRVAIARALLADTPIIVMDEAVSNLDTQTDQEIQQTIRSLADQKTVIVIAHRLSTIQEAGQIIVMKDGRVVQQGSHEALMNMDGYYRELVITQLQDRDTLTSVD